MFALAQITHMSFVIADSLELEKAQVVLKDLQVYIACSKMVSNFFLDLIPPNALGNGCEFWYAVADLAEEAKRLVRALNGKWSVHIISINDLSYGPLKGQTNQWLAFDMGKLAKKLEDSLAKVSEDFVGRRANTVRCRLIKVLAVRPVCLQDGKDPVLSPVYTTYPASKSPDGHFSVAMRGCLAAFDKVIRSGDEMFENPWENLVNQESRSAKELTVTLYGQSGSGKSTFKEKLIAGFYTALKRRKVLSLSLLQFANNKKAEPSHIVESKSTHTHDDYLALLSGFQKSKKYVKERPGALNNDSSRALSVTVFAIQRFTLSIVDVPGSEPMSSSPDAKKERAAINTLRGQVTELLKSIQFPSLKKPMEGRAAKNTLASFYSGIKPQTQMMICFIPPAGQNNSYFTCDTLQWSTLQPAFTQNPFPAPLSAQFSHPEGTKKSLVNKT